MLIGEPRDKIVRGAIRQLALIGQMSRNVLSQYQTRWATSKDDVCAMDSYADGGAMLGAVRPYLGRLFHFPRRSHMRKHRGAIVQIPYVQDGHREELFACVAVSAYGRGVDF